MWWTNFKARYRAFAGRVRAHIRLIRFPEQLDAFILELFRKKAHLTPMEMLHGVAGALSPKPPRLILASLVDLRIGRIRDEGLLVAVGSTPAYERPYRLTSEGQARLNGVEDPPDDED